MSQREGKDAGIEGKSDKHSGRAYQRTGLEGKRGGKSAPSGKKASCVTDSRYEKGEERSSPLDPSKGRREIGVAQENDINPHINEREGRLPFCVEGGNSRAKREEERLAGRRGTLKQAPKKGYRAEKESIDPSEGETLAHRENARRRPRKSLPQRDGKVLRRKKKFL